MAKRKAAVSLQFFHYARIQLRYSSASAALHPPNQRRRRNYLNTSRLLQVPNSGIARGSTRLSCTLGTANQDARDLRGEGADDSGRDDEEEEDEVDEVEDDDDDDEGDEQHCSTDIRVGTFTDLTPRLFSFSTWI